MCLASSGSCCRETLYLALCWCPTWFTQKTIRYFPSSRNYEIQLWVIPNSSATWSLAVVQTKVISKEIRLQLKIPPSLNRLVAQRAISHRHGNCYLNKWICSARNVLSAGKVNAWGLPCLLAIMETRSSDLIHDKQHQALGGLQRHRDVATRRLDHAWN